MDLQSLGLRTDLIFNRFEGEIADHGDHIAVRTPARPDYLWGNYVIMPHAPATDTAVRWIKIFEREIGPRARMGFATFAWDAPDGAVGDVSWFLAAGFKLAQSHVFTASALVKQANVNTALQVRPLESEDDWAQYVDVHLSPTWDYGPQGTQRKFIEGQRDTLRAMVDAGLGLRFGAFAGRKLVGDLGIYWDGDIARFNNVGTHPAARRQGVCATLVYEAGNAILARRRGTTLVLKALKDSDAARLYVRAGFAPTQIDSQLEWFAPPA